MWDAETACPEAWVSCAQPLSKSPADGSAWDTVTPSLPEEGMGSASIRAAPPVCTGTPRASRGPEGTEALKERPPTPTWSKEASREGGREPPGAQGANRVPLPCAQGVGEAQTEPGSGHLADSVLRPYPGQRVTRPQ